MALEDALKALTEAVEANTAALQGILASGGKPAAPAAAKPKAEKPAAPAAAKPKAEKPDESEASLEDLRNALRKFADAKNPDVADREAIIVAAFAKVNAKGVKTVPADKRQAFIEHLEKKDKELKAKADAAPADDVLGEDDEDDEGDDWRT